MSRPARDEIDIEALKRAVGMLGAWSDPSIDLPVETQVEHLIHWATAVKPDSFKRSVPVSKYDHDELICGALSKLVHEIDRLRQQLADTQPVIEAAERWFDCTGQNGHMNRLSALLKLQDAIVAWRAAGREVQP